MKKIIILCLALMPWCVNVTQAQGWWWWVVTQQNLNRAYENREQRKLQEQEEAQKKAYEYSQKQKLVKKWQGRMGNVELPPSLATVLKEDARVQQQRPTPRRETRQLSSSQPRLVTVPVMSTPTVSKQELLAVAMVIDSLKRLVAEKELMNRALSARCDSFQGALVMAKTLPAEVDEGPKIFWAQENQSAVKEKAYAPIVRNVNLQPTEEGNNTFAVCIFVFIIGWILFWGWAIWPSSDEKSLST